MTTDPATAPLPLPVCTQDSLDGWTKMARLIAQVLISAGKNWRAGQETRPYGAISVMGDTMAAAAKELILFCYDLLKDLKSP